jgi:hypothetical protein
MAHILFMVLVVMAITAVGFVSVARERHAAELAKGVVRRSPIYWSGLGWRLRESRMLAQ